MWKPRSALLLWIVASACTRLNPDFGDDAAGTGGMTSGASSGPTSTGAPPPDPATATEATTGGAQPGTTAIATASTAESEPGECWRVPLRVVPTSFVDPQDVLEEVPVLVDLSVFDRPGEPEDVRFYRGADLLPHEPEFDGAFAWVRVPRIESRLPFDFEVILGSACDHPNARPPDEVWSNGFIAVWHFDGISKGAFIDSANAIGLQLGEGSALSSDTPKLGRYLQKTTNQILTAVDPRLDISGQQDVTVTSWVRLDGNDSHVLPWQGNARHREIVSKLPGYRLTAVFGEVSEISTTANLPFFNIAQVLERSGHTIARGPSQLPPDVWTMVSGTYSATQLRAQCFVGALSGELEPVELPPGRGDGQDIAVGRWLFGGLDELRISNVARSPDWVRVQFSSMSGTLIEPGQPEPY